MKTKIKLRFELSDHITDDQRLTFLESLEVEIKSCNAHTEEREDFNDTEWIIRIPNSKLEKGEIIEQLGEYFLENDEFVLNWEIK